VKEYKVYRDNRRFFIFPIKSTVNHSVSCPFRRDLYLDFARSDTDIIKKKPKKNFKGKTYPLYPSSEPFTRVPVLPSYDSRLEVSENRDRGFYMGLIDSTRTCTGMKLTKVWHIFRKSLLSGTGSSTVL